MKIGRYDYQLWLSTDLYTEKYTQWFYFRVENIEPGKVYRFTIMNLMKSSSLYSMGMKPLMYSERQAKGIGWRRVGSNIKYYKNELTREDGKGEHSLFSLSWTVVFPHSRDRCYFAHCYPYTYTTLQEYVSKLCQDPLRASYCKRRILTRSLAGNNIYLMTITNPSKCPMEAKRKRAVVLTARVHPGETNSSWIMKGLLDYITSDTPDAKLLRDTFVFKVIPMLNPDGVIVGNYRCSLSGRDLNRNYNSTFKDSFPPVWHTREFIKRLSQEREITLYCDFHGHSRKQNVFFYGCENRANIEHGLKERVFPMMMSKNCKDMFSFKKCKFKVQKSKSGTGRVVMWNMGISNSYTMETTFCGSALGDQDGVHFTTADFESLGYYLCDTLLDYCDPDASKYYSILDEVEVYMKYLLLERLKKKGIAGVDAQISDIDVESSLATSESSSSGSDSSVSDGLPMHIIYSDQHPPKKKKKRYRTRTERNRRRSGSQQKKRKLKESEVKLEKTSMANDSEQPITKNPQRTSLSKSRKIPTSSIHGSCYSNSERSNKTKNWDSLDCCRPNHYTSLFFRQNTPHFRCSGQQAKFGLAASSPVFSLDAWSDKEGNSNELSYDDDENNFIDRYMSQQICLRINGKDNGKFPHPKPNKPEKIPKSYRSNASSDMVAKAQDEDLLGRVDDLRTQGDEKYPKGQNCLRHKTIFEKSQLHEDETINDVVQTVEEKNMLNAKPKAYIARSSMSVNSLSKSTLPKEILKLRRNCKSAGLKNDVLSCTDVDIIAQGISRMSTAGECASQELGDEVQLWNS
ncbi:cytosolic carboxypeptidase 2-like isoform X2 [Xenia sp. Carnegie-2017]|nr:cytosolic carboxypeptidase 2-like isoform X2 [Xenia sp. Carnegie-2017]